MRIAYVVAALTLVAVCDAQSRRPENNAGTASGTVFEDKNGNGRRDVRERGLAGIWVSNQRDFVQTDRQGRWKLPHWNDTVFYVVKPRNWMTPVDHHQVPKFFYVHKPAGSPPSLKFAGVKPTGPLPKSIDFALRRRPEPETFRALFFGDTQPRDVREVDYIFRDIIEPLLHGKEKFEFGVTLGDVVFDDLDVIQPLKEGIALLGLPWYYVLGNHDINYDSHDDRDSDETWHRHFGPNYYSFDHGPTHFVVLDNVEWIGRDNAKKEDPNRNNGYYRAGLGATQMQWLKADLAKVPAKQLVVLLMHIPMTEIRERAELYKLVAQRPYALSVAAHTHMQEHRFITQKNGWPKPTPHHHVINVTTCGSWWTGSPDSRGVPHTTMRDGAPHGYSVFSFDGNQYSIQYRAARRPFDYQMNIIAPDVLPTGTNLSTVFHANVFGGSEKSKVEFSFAGSGWKPMTRVLAKDPLFMETVERDKGLQRPYRPLPGADISTHLWQAKLTGSYKPGTYGLHVRTIDMFGQQYLSTRAIRIR
ncbi:MAG: hypothetical protein HONBIEJF_01707 [Fimbriimonadaceae bacterium]|nr:hypothetical protein [Fimbriimonadaceae bacterium]